MRAGLVAAAVVLLLVPAAGAQSSKAPEITDGQGDVIWHPGAPAMGPFADTIDIVSGGVGGESADEITFFLKIVDLSGLEDLGANPYFHAQYALTFSVSGTEDRFSMRAMNGGAMHGSGTWRFSIHNQTTDEWPTISATAQENTLIWHAPKTLLGNLLRNSTLTNFTVNTWNSYAPSGQTADWASAPSTTEYVLKEGPTPSLNPTPPTARTTVTVTVTAGAAATVAAAAEGSASSPGIALLLLAAGAFVGFRARRR